MNQFNKKPDSTPPTKEPSQKTAPSPSFTAESRGPAPAIQPQALTLPKGGGAIRGIGEKFQANAVTGTGGFSIPLPFTPGRSGMGPAMALSYDSGSGNGEFGLGWNIGLPAITRKTEKQLPRYWDNDETDTFLLVGAEDLVPVLDEEGHRFSYSTPTHTVYPYRPRIEGLYAKIERWVLNLDGGTHWRVTTKDNLTSYYGQTSASWITDPDNSGRIFSWLIDKTVDAKNNLIFYFYKQENNDNIDAVSLSEHHRTSYAKQYLKEIRYGHYTGGGRVLRFHYRVIFDYGEHTNDEITETTAWDARDDRFSDYRAGFEIRTNRLCKRVLMFHNFAAANQSDSWELVKALELAYTEGAVVSYLSSVTLTGYRYNGSTYDTKSFPAIKFDYTAPSGLFEVKHIDGDSLQNLPAGLAASDILWTDLDGEGLSGILHRSPGGLHYKPNTGEGTFGPIRVLDSLPSVAGNGLPELGDIDGDGRQEILVRDGGLQGYVTRTDDGWESFIPYRSNPVIDWNDPNMRMVDLDGDGWADLLITEDRVLRWRASLGTEGYGTDSTVPVDFDEEEGPVLLFSDPKGTVFLADMNGDGLTDIVRIRNGEICYWPNLGYGRFGKKVTMENAPTFDNPDKFDPNYIKLGDIDGSGTTDICYFGDGKTRFWKNCSGNSWSAETAIGTFLPVDSAATVSLIDLTGTGTLCLVWSSKLPNRDAIQLSYIDLTEGKPHLLKSIDNNMGRLITLTYKPSTYFYLLDRTAGTPWVTKLPFPVHVVQKVETEDQVAGCRYTTQYAYHHGYFDGVEREFRGFGMVETTDTETYDEYQESTSGTSLSQTTAEVHYVAPVLTKSWYHTGAYLAWSGVSTHFEDEYFQGIDTNPNFLPDTVIDDDSSLSVEERREAYRALKGRVLRQEVYESGDAVPHIVTESNYIVKRLQERQTNKHAVFAVDPRESVACHYEQDEDDPRIVHDLTLAVDQYGNIEKAITIAYPRQGSGHPTQQSAYHAVLTVNDYINKPDGNSEEDPFYLLGAPKEIKRYEIGNLSSLTADNYLSFDDVAGLVTTALAGTILRYDQSLSSGTQARLFGWEQRFYWNAAQDAALTLGAITDKALLHHVETAQLNADLVTEVFSTDVTSTMLTDNAKYVSHNSYYWNPGLIQYYTIGTFYLPNSTEDAFGNELTIDWDSHKVLPVSVTDAVGNTVTAGIDYRTMQYNTLTDPNGTVTEVLFDPLGMLIVSTIYGEEDSVAKGDLPLSGNVDPGDDYDEPSSPSIADIVTNPGNYVQNATLYHYYDLDAWSSRQEPVQAITIQRERHVSDNPDPLNYQYNIVYTDGFGRELQRKMRVAPHVAFERDENGVLVLEGGVPELTEEPVDPCWLTSGRTIYNNKQLPVKQYEPFFSSLYTFESEQELAEYGVTVEIFYDPLGRVIRTDHPDGTYATVAFTPWEVATADRNDNVADSDWYATMSTWPDTDPNYLKIRAAAAKALDHADTPRIDHLDTLGRIFLTVEDDGDEETPDVNTTTYYDIQGNVTSVTDPRDNTAFTHRYDMLGQVLKREQMDSGIRKAFLNVMGNPLIQWDSRSNVITSTYDALHRLTGVSVTNGTTRLAEEYIWGEGQTSPADHNLRGRLYRQHDGAGEVTYPDYDFKGNPIDKRRKVLTVYDAAVDWGGTPTLSDEYTHTATFDALNRVIEATTPDDSIYIPTYDEGALLLTVDVKLRGSASSTSFVENIEYNTQRQREIIVYANGVTTTYEYDPKTFRLTQLLSTTTSQTLQDFNYTYDPMGNITSIVDDATQTIYFSNNAVEPDRDYTYDPLYRLTDATGREHVNQPGNEYADFPTGINLPHPNDPQSMRTYTRSYTYDKAGNLTELSHVAQNGNWSRSYTIAGTSNKLSSTTIGQTTVNYTLDDHGNHVDLPNMDSIVWDFRDRMVEADLGGGGMIYFLYDAAGNRIRKVIENTQGNIVKERLYLDGFELYHEFDVNEDIDFERETLHVMDDQVRIAMVETKTIEDGDPITTPTSLIRYELDDHLGTHAVELSDTGALISFEEYYPYGGTSFQSTSSSSQVSQKRYRYNGKEKDEETNLYYYGARYYISWLGRWMNCDPSGEVDGLNLYAYVRDNPILYMDPEGREGSFLDSIKKGLDAATTWVHDTAQKAGQAIADTGEKVIEGAGIKNETAQGAIRTLANMDAAIVGATLETTVNLAPNIAKSLISAGEQIGTGAAQIAQGEVGAGLKSMANATGLVTAGEKLAASVDPASGANALERVKDFSEATAIIAGNAAMGLAAAKAITPASTSSASASQVTETSVTNTLHKPSAQTEVINSPEIKAASALESSRVLDKWNDYLGERTHNINPRTGKVDPNRIFSEDNTRSIRFGKSEMDSMGTSKAHYHEEAWRYNPQKDTMTVTNTLQRIKNGRGKK